MLAILEIAHISPPRDTISSYYLVKYSTKISDHPSSAPMFRIHSKLCKAAGITLDTRIGKNVEQLGKCANFVVRMPVAV